MTLINRQGIYSSIVALLLLALYPRPLWGSGVGETNTVVLVRHAPTINGGTIEGSLQQLTGEGATLNSGTLITGDWWVPGTPTVRTNGRPQFAGILPGTGSPTPTGYSITLNGNVTLGYLRTRTDPGTLPTVTAPPQPTGTRSVTITSSNQSIGDPATLRHLTLNGNVGQKVVPPGTYGNFTVNGGSGLTLGISGTTQPVIYNLQNLTLNGQSRLDVVGPILLTVANGFTANGMVGTTNRSSWLQLRVASGGFTLNGGCTVHGQIVVPAGTVIVNGNSRLIGSVQCDRLIINSGGCIIGGGSGGTTNQPPTANNQNLTTPEDTVLPIMLTGSDPEGAPLTYTVLSWPAHGTLDPPLANTNRFTYSPAANYNGSDSFTFKVNDGQTNSLPATVSITITPVNDAPELWTVEDYHVMEGGLLSVTNKATDIDLPANALLFSLTNAPSGMTIDATNGLITWTPTEVQGPSTNLVTVVVTDNGTPALSDSKSFTVVVTEVNTAPVLAAIADQTIAEGATLIVTNSATDIDVPVNALVFSLTNAPSGMTIDATNGLITWTPSEVQGPSTNLVTVVVTDNGTPALSDSKSFTVVVTEVNTAPVLAAIADQTIAEGATLVVTNSATDIDLPANALVFSLTNAPNGMTIDATNGLITWTPTEVQGPSTNLVTVVVTDSGTPVLSDSKSFTVIVNEVNTAPVLAAITDQTIAEGATLVVTNSATDIDLPANALVFSLTNAPSGMTIDATTGLITWTPTEVQGPSTNLVTVVVTDNGTPVLSDSKSFTVIVNEVNTAPVLASITDQTIAEGATLIVTNSATDIDVPANTLVFSLTNAPSGMTVDATNGLITWTPTEVQGPSTNLVTVVVTDNGTPALSDSKSFTVVVTEVNTAPVLAAIADQSIAEGATLIVTNSATDIDMPANTLLFSLTNAPSGMTIDATNGLITWTPSEVQGPSTNVVTVVVTDSGTPALSDSKTFRVVVTAINDAPFITAPAAVSVDEDTVLSFSDTNTITLGDVDAGAGQLQLGLAAGHGVLTLNQTNGLSWVSGTNGADAMIVTGTLADLNNALTNLTYLGATNYYGSDSLILTVDDQGNSGAGGALTASALIAINVLPINDPPIALAQSLVTDEDTGLPITLSGSDADGDALTFTVVSGPTNGVLSGVAPSLIYLPNTNYNGPDAFSFTVSDGSAISVISVVNITVNPVNDAPVPVAQHLTTPEDTSLPIILSGSDTDGDSLTFTVVALPTNGVLSGTAPNVIYTPAANFNGSDVFTFVANDGQTNSALYRSA